MSALRGARWPEAALDGALLGLFMLSASGFGTLLFAPASPAVEALGLPGRSALMGLAMGATALALFRSSWGQRTGAHMNPAVTLAFWRLGKIETRDAAAYALCQPLGGALGVVLATLVLGEAFSAPPVGSVATLPGRWGAGAAFAAELAMTFVLFSIVLRLSNDPRRARFTPVAAAALVALFVAVEAPVSGMSLSPARTFASALPSGQWRGFWIYLVAPPLGMLAAAELFVRTRGAGAVLCAKLHHTDRHACIFRCGWCRHSAVAPDIEAPVRAGGGEGE